MTNRNLFWALLLSPWAAFGQQTGTHGPKIEEAKNELYALQPVVADMDNPWGMDFLPDGGIIVSERKGALILFKNGQKTIIKGTPEVFTGGQGGLLDVKLHPDYAKNGWIYISYSQKKVDGATHTAIMRGKLEGLNFVQTQMIYKAVPEKGVSVHFGSRIEFDKKGYLYFSMGERYKKELNPQDIKRDGGKIYRLYDDGRIPESNPFYNVAGAKQAIYSYGHRNPQGMTLHPQTGAIWTHEHGPNGGDEINVIKAGKNYGWPEICYCRDYDESVITKYTHKEGMEQPLYYWLPSIAPSGMAFASDKYPEWKGSLLVGSLKFQYLERLALKGDIVVSREKLFGGLGRVRNVKQAPDGSIYVGIEGKGIYKIVRKR